MRAAASTRVYLDEDVPDQLGDFLAGRGVIVHLAREVEGISADDHIHIRRCASEGWALVTLNRRHFQRLHALWMTFHYWGVLEHPHGGILTVREQTPPIPGEWGPPIYDLLVRERSLQGKMYMWRPSTRDWEPQPVEFK